MVDVQGRSDERNIAIQKVGVRNLRYPVTVLDKVNQEQHTVATVSLYANLPHHYKGTHMSRFIEVFNRHYTDIRMPTFLTMLEQIRVALDAETAFGEVHFPYFVQKAAPVSRQPGMMSYHCWFSAEKGADGSRFIVGLEVPVATVCPCSKEISSRGAHNQRGTVRVQVQLGPFFWLEDLIELVEASASSGLYTLLKREDERFVTEYAYDHPVFVEDLVRASCLAIESRYPFPWFSVEAENMESIHNHDAYAFVERGEQQWQVGNHGD